MDDKILIPRPMTIEEFLPFVGKMFEVDCFPNSVEIMLVEAKPGRFGRPDTSAPFSLIFHSTPDILLADGLYVIRSGAVGPASIFITPIMAPLGSTPGYYYQSVFN